MRGSDRHLLAAFGRNEPWRCAYIGGTFDCLHRGHLALLDKAGKIAQSVVVSVNRDEFAERYKRRPLMPLADRIAVLSACRLVDDVILNGGDEDSRPAIALSGCDVIVHGSDWHRGNGLLEQMGLTDAWLQAHGIELITLPYTTWTSTTQLLLAYDERRPCVNQQIHQDLAASSLYEAANHVAHSLIGEHHGRS
jgi:glycerol-3-phosphate cytidylyltransferase